MRRAAYCWLLGSCGCGLVDLWCGLGDVACGRCGRIRALRLTLEMLSWNDEEVNLFGFSFRFFIFVSFFWGFEFVGRELCE